MYPSDRHETSVDRFTTLINISNTPYVPTALGERYDAYLHLDRTNALTPLRPLEQGTGEAETYPTGL